MWMNLVSRGEEKQKTKERPEERERGMYIKCFGGTGSELGSKKEKLGTIAVYPWHAGGQQYRLISEWTRSIQVMVHGQFVVSDL